MDESVLAEKVDSEGDEWHETEARQLASVAGQVWSFLDRITGFSAFTEGALCLWSGDQGAALAKCRISA